MQHPLTAHFARLSTGIKMLIILSAALLPLGLIALLTSLESAHTNQLNRESEARLMASESARQLNATIAATTISLRQAISAVEQGIVSPETCQRALAAISDSRPKTHYALFDRRGRQICATLGWSMAPVRPPAPDIGTEVHLVERSQVLRLSLAGKEIFGAAELPKSLVASATRQRVAAGSYGIVLRQGALALPLDSIARPGMLGQAMTMLSPVAGGQVALEMKVNAMPIGALEVLMVLLPLMMWLAAAIIGWLVVDRLLLRPLGQMQKAITTYGIGAGPLLIPAMTTPAQEIRGLGEAFRDVTVKLALHDAELEQGLARQTRLTREVHHRVKNNLQVVSSLINLHARGAVGEEAAHAYATIQRRVDALAVVHRNHYAELEENRGVGLRPLISELASNLRATAPTEATQMPISLDLMPAFASQDIAVPIAFLITEIVEMVMICDPNSGLTVRLAPTDEPGRACLSLTAAGLIQGACGDVPTRANRVIEGLSRQLRAPLTRDEVNGVYSITISVVPPTD